MEADLAESVVANGMICVWFAAWQQHDVQELCRVMFEALEQSWKNTDQANLITQLYQGKIKDYVKCLQVCSCILLLVSELNIRSFCHFVYVCVC